MDHRVHFSFGLSDPDDNAILYLIETKDGNMVTWLIHVAKMTIRKSSFIREGQDVNQEEAENYNKQNVQIFL